MAQPEAIDLHTHIVPAEFPAYAGTHDASRWPQMAAGSDCRHKNVMIAGKNFRTVSDECWEVSRRVETMDRMNIGMQVLSPMPELLSYWFPAEDGLAIARHINGAISGMVAQNPKRFAGLGMVPLQDPELASRELENLMRDGFRGVEIGSSINGVPIGDAKFEPFFAAAEKLGAAVFIHALHPAGLDRIVGPPRLVPLIAFPGEIATGLASIVTGGMFERHPRLKLCFSHGGGTFGIVLPRLMQGWRLSKIVREQIAQSPEEQARRFYYDTVVFSPTSLAFLIASFGVTQLCIGTDYPFELSEREPLDLIAALNLGEPERAALHSGNVRRFLNLRP
jgi:aminocarboxymuconate-semialdehyde decarboxylase